MLDMAERGAVRDERGRFMPGMSGNPAGKLPGTRNRATVLKAALDSAEGPAMARVVIDKALAGDVVTAKFCVARLMPQPRGRAIEIDLPSGARARDLVAAFDETVRAMAAGEITPDEAVQVTRVLDGRRKVIEAAWREAERTAPCSAPKPSPDLKPSPNPKPSPSGRGLGEGVGSRSDAIDRVAATRPHPDPLPQGEGTRLDERGLFSGGACAAGRGRGSFATNLLHSTCISRRAPVVGGFRAGVQGV